jgi:HSP20 family protein
MIATLIPRTWAHSRNGLQLNHVLDELFADAFGTAPQPSAAPAVWGPALEGYEKDGNIVVRADLPGVDPAQVEVSLDGDTLTISGERKSESESSKNGSHVNEVRYGSFRRSVTVPEGIDPERVTARYTNGVLEVTLPMPVAAQPRKVAVQVATDAPKSA